jgi:hypothetical protein
MLTVNVCELQTPHQPISAPQFSVGQSKSCNLWLKDQPVSKTLCRLRRLEVRPYFYGSDSLNEEHKNILKYFTGFDVLLSARRPM